MVVLPPPCELPGHSSSTDPAQFAGVMTYATAMDVNCRQDFDCVDSSVIEDIDGDFAETFCGSEKVSNLRITRFSVKAIDDENGECFGQNRLVFGSAELGYFAV